MFDNSTSPMHKMLILVSFSCCSYTAQSRQGNHARAVNQAFHPSRYDHFWLDPYEKHQGDIRNTPSASKN